MLGTHDIQNISVISSHPGNIRVSGNWIQRSTARGIIVIVYSATDIHYHVREERGDRFYVNVERLLGGEYNVSVFVIEKNGRPFERAASTPVSITVGVPRTPTSKCQLSLFLNVSLL